MDIISAAPTAPIPTVSTPREPKGTQRGFRKLLIAAAILAAVLLGTLLGIWIKGSQVTTVFPDAPAALAVACGEEGRVEIPEVRGVHYEQIREGTALSVTAKPADSSYRLTGGAATSWSFDLAPVPCPEPAAPSGSEPDQVDKLIQEAKDTTEGAVEWTKEYGPGIWNKLKEAGEGLKERVEDWSQSE